MGGKFHLKLNNGERPIANKYREGKMKRTLKRELKVLEIAKREALETSLCATILVSIMGFVVCVVVKPSRAASLMVGAFSCCTGVRINSVRVRRLWVR